METKFNVGQKIYYVVNNSDHLSMWGYSIFVKEGQIHRIEINEKGTRYILNDGSFVDVSNFERPTSLTENDIFLTKEEANQAKQEKIIITIKTQVEILNRIFEKENIKKLKVVLHND